MATTTDEKKAPQAEPPCNYGSVDINDGAGLPPNWKRDPNEYPLMSATIVGHANGVCDAYLDAAPNARHQFSWCDPTDREAVALRRMQGYRFVTDDHWTINEILWTWEADDKDKTGPKYCTRFADRLMARSEALYAQDKSRKAAQPNATDKVNKELARHPGAVTARDSDGVALRPMSRQ